MLRPVYKLKNIYTLNQLYHSYYRKLLVGLEYLFFRSGPMTMGASQLCGFTKSDPSLATPNIQFHVAPMSADKLGGTALHNFLPLLLQLVIYVLQVVAIFLLVVMIQEMIR